MNLQTFQELHEKYRHRLLHAMIARVKHLEVAEDVTSAAFVKAFEHRDHFRGEAHFYTWLYRIAVNQSILRFRRQETRAFESIDAPEAQELGYSDLVADKLERSEQCLRIRKILRQIPVAYRRVLRNHLIRGYSVRRIAKLEKVPLGTVLSRIFNGKKLLREAWEA